MLVQVLLLNQAALTLLGLLYRHFVIGVLFRPDDADLQSLIADEYLCDHIPLVNVSLLATTLNRMRASHPDYVDLLFGAQFLARHIFIPCNAIFFFWLLNSLKFKLPITVLTVLIRDEYNLNVLAGALYGTWIGLAICSALSSLACAITFLLVRLIHCASDWCIMENSVDGRKKSARLEAKAIGEQIVQLELERTFAESAMEATQIAEKIVQLFAQIERADLRWMMAHLEELQTGGLLHEQLNLDNDLAINDSPWTIFKYQFRMRLTHVSANWNIWSATTQMPICITVIACALGYLPYALLGTWTGGRLLTMETGELYEDQVPYWRFDWLIFALAVYLTLDYLDWITFLARRMNRGILQVQQDIAFTRRILGDEEELEIAEVNEEEE